MEQGASTDSNAEVCREVYPPKPKTRRGGRGKSFTVANKWDRKWLLSKVSAGERALYLAARQLGHDVVLKMELGRDVVDVGFPKLRLCLEVGEGRGYDRRRLIAFRAQGWRLERLSEEAVLADPTAELARMGVVNLVNSEAKKTRKVF